MGLTSSGLLFPRDLDAWRRWQQRQNPLRRLRSIVRPVGTVAPWLAVRGTSPSVLVALDAPTPTQRAALLRPLELLSAVDAAVLLPEQRPDVLPGQNWQWIDLAETNDGGRVPESLGGLRAVLSVGHYLPVGALADRWAGELGAERLVVQHGLLTPYAPPLPEDSRLFSFVDADAEFAASGRTDVIHTNVGSQLLWTAAAEQSQMVDPGVRPVYLGQLHGAELPRHAKVRAARLFCRTTGALYRPHPAERDTLSRIQHALWERQGIELDRSGSALAALGRPVVSVFSTGVLEAAARGLPAWVSYPHPPRWLEEFWERYSMSSWSREPTSAPVRGSREPAAAIAEHIACLAGAN